VPLQQGTDISGHALEHLVIQELRAYLSYRHPDTTLSYWHTLDNKYEVDAVIGQANVAIEVKSSKNISPKDTKGLKAFGEEYPDAKLYLLTMEERPRKLNNIEVWPVEQFLKRLWNNKVICQHHIMEDIG
jgi:predicted AAA+ superfamily ATPase